MKPDLKEVFYAALCGAALAVILSVGGISLLISLVPS